MRLLFDLALSLLSPRAHQCSPECERLRDENYRLRLDLEASRELDRIMRKHHERRMAS